MTRRSVIAGVAAVLVATKQSTAQQVPAKFPRIGILSPADSERMPTFEAFSARLRDLGWVDGQNIRIEYRLAAGHAERLPRMAAELVSLAVDVIVTDAIKALQAAHDAASTIPIVMATGPPDPVVAGFVKSFAHPGGNITGFILQPPEMSGKRLQILKDAFPSISRIAALRNPASVVSTLRSTEDAARTLGVQLRVIEAAAAEQIPTAFEEPQLHDADAVVVLPDATFWNHRRDIVARVNARRLPAIYPEREYADDGGLLAYGASVPDNFRLAADYVDRILKGASPAELPIQQAVKFDFVVNLRTARELGLTIPPAILARADEVIE